VAAVRATAAHRRGRLLRRLVVYTTIAISLGRIVFPAVFIPWADTLNLPAVYCAGVLATLITCSLEWSTRLQRDELLQRYAHYLEVRGHRNRDAERAACDTSPDARAFRRLATRFSMVAGS
jgi:hypothetical protein